jgi:acylphosphatase
VGFREFVVRRAESLALTGYVRNLANGRSVEVIAEGSRESLDLLVTHLLEGPGGAVVQSCDKTWGTASGAYHDFGVRY